MKARTKWALALAVAAVFCVAGAPSFATDRPYTVTAEGVELVGGTVFEAHGHVNWRTTKGQGSMHFDPNNGQPGGTYIGATFFPIPLTDDECITWVQVAGFNYHFGEHGEEPVCASGTPPTSSPTPPAEEPSPEPSTTSAPTPAPTSSTPSPTTSPSPTPLPTSPVPTPSSSPSLTPTVTPSPSPSPTTEPSPSPSPSTGIGTPEFPPSATPSPQADEPTNVGPSTGPAATEETSTQNRRGDLAATGVPDWAVFVVAGLALLAIGAVLMFIRHMGADERKARKRP